MNNKLKEENTNGNILLFVLIFKLKCSPLKGEKYFCKKVTDSLSLKPLHKYGAKFKNKISVLIISMSHNKKKLCLD